MRTLLLNLPWRENNRLGVRAGSRWPFTSSPEEDGSIHYVPFPFFLAYATALLKKEKKQAKLIDAVAQGLGEEELIEQVGESLPELILAETSTPSFYNDLRLIDLLLARLPGSQIALCGPHVNAFPEEILRRYRSITYLLIGEYEYTLLDLINCLEEGLSPDSIAGLAYRDGEQVRVNAPRPTIENLDMLPWPERKDIPIYRYNDGFAGLPSPNVQVWSSRGCPFECTYCLWPQAIYRERKYRPRDPKDVADEVKYLLSNFNFRAVYFDDDTFNIDKQHVLEICEEMKKRMINVPWAAMARADLMDEEMLRCMRRAGLYAVKYGIESADEGVLRLCKKDMDLDKAKEMIALTRGLGVKVHLTFCIGLPGETKESIRKTESLIQELKPDSLQFSFAVPFPGTEYSAYLKKNGWLISEDWQEYDGSHKCAARTKDLTARELEDFKIDLSRNLNL